MRRAYWIIAAPILVLIFFFSALKYLIIPPLSRFALSQAHIWSQNHGPATIQAEKINVSFLRPSIQIENIKISAHDELKSYFKEINVDKIYAQMDLFQIFTGRFSISALIIENPQTEVFIDPLMKGPSQSEPIPMQKLFSILNSIPIQKIWLDSLDLNLRWDEEKSSVHLKKVFLASNYESNRINLKSDFGNVEVFVKQMAPFQFNLKNQISLTTENLNIISSEIKLGQSLFQIQGKIDPIENVTINPEGFLNIDTDLNLLEVYQWIKTYAPQIKLPPLYGGLSAKGKITLGQNKKISGSLELKTQNVKIDQFQIGSTQMKAKYLNNKIEFEDIEAHHPAGDVKFTETDLSLKSPFEFKSKLHVKKLDLQNLFLSLNLKNIPVWLNIAGTADCRGQFENLDIKCKADLTGQNLSVKKSMATNGSNDHHFEIVSLDHFGAQGLVTVDLKKVGYTADVFVGSDRGKSDGIIDFENGFKINFNTPNLNFKNIKNLVHLQFEGSAPIEGSTSGDSDSATMQMKIRPKDFIFEKYQLGTLETILSYEKGHLKLNQITGRLENSQYQGELDLNLTDDQIQGALKLPTVELKDVAWVFKNIYEFPLSVQALGQGSVNFYGPLNFWKLSYNLESHFKNGKIAGESFSNFWFNVKSENGIVKTEKILLTKNNSTLEAQGIINQKQEADLTFKAKNFKLEESELITRVNNQIYGTINATGRLKSSIFKPEFDLSGTLIESVLGDQEVPNSSFSLSRNFDRTMLSANFFGNKIQTEISTSPIKIRVKTTDWSYAPILSLLGGSDQHNDYETFLSSDVDLASPIGSGWENLTGSLKVSRFLLKRGSLEVSPKSPIELQWSQGQIFVKNFELQGTQNQFLEISGAGFTFDKLNLNARGQVEVKLLHLFLPFFDDLGGLLETESHIYGSWDRPQILGHAHLENIFIKIKGFPHPIEKINSEINFSQNKLLIPSLTATLGGGPVSAEGDIQIEGIRNVPVNVKIHATGLNLNVPDKIKSSGNADLVFSGKWFPYLLSGVYKINTGLFEKEFGDPSGNSHVQTSPYLPKTIKESSFQPILLDLNVGFEKSMLVKNSQIEGIVSGQLQVKGTPESPILLGKVEAEKGAKIIFKDKVFDVQSSIVNFTDNSTELNPDLFVNAQSRVNDYDINLIVQGQAKTPVIKLSSIPSLSENDIISLLALGITSTKLEQNVQSGEQAKQTATEVFGSVLNQTIGKDFQSKFGLNLQLTNSYDSTKNISVPKVTLSRQLGPKTTVQVSRQLSNSNTTSDVKIQYQLNQNLSAVGSFEARNPSEDTATKSLDKDQQSIFGLDLEFRREFK